MSKKIAGAGVAGALVRPCDGFIDGPVLIDGHGSIKRGGGNPAVKPSHPVNRDLAQDMLAIVPTYVVDGLRFKSRVQAAPDYWIKQALPRRNALRAQMRQELDRHHRHENIIGFGDFGNFHGHNFHARRIQNS